MLSNRVDLCSDGIKKKKKPQSICHEAFSKRSVMVTNNWSDRNFKSRYLTKQATVTSTRSHIQRMYENPLKVTKQFRCLNRDIINEGLKQINNYEGLVNHRKKSMVKSVTADKGILSVSPCCRPSYSNYLKWLVFQTTWNSCFWFVTGKHLWAKCSSWWN